MPQKNPKLRSTLPLPLSLSPLSLLLWSKSNSSVHLLDGGVGLCSQQWRRPA